MRRSATARSMTMRAILPHFGLTLALLPASAAYADPPPGYDFLAPYASMRKASTENKAVLRYFARYGSTAPG